ncbi:P27 family phage terminase small subunit [Candidatus Darwinibacter acetoxidans]
MSKERRQRIKESLLEQLEMKGADMDHFVDLVEDYMSLWDVKNDLLEDIKKRGVMYKDFSSVGIEMMKNNPSVRELVGINRQMLSILKDLDINTKTVARFNDDDEM